MTYRSALQLGTLFAIAIIASAVPLSLGITIALLVAWLLIGWVLRLRDLISGHKGPDLVLEAITASHFVEKVRWCLDRMGVDYREKRHAGTLGAFFLGRTVPKIHFRSGAVTSSIGNSSEILRYLWGRYGLQQGTRAGFLEPSADAVAWESRCDRYGVDLQRWIYGHILQHRGFTLRAWGLRDPAIAAWQKAVIVMLYPLLRFLMRRAFQITQAKRIKSRERIRQHLTAVERHLQHHSFLADNRLTFADTTMAALSYLWIFPDSMADGQFKDILPDADDIPERMRRDMDEWQSDFPLTTAYIRRLYRDERSTKPIAPHSDKGAD